MRQVEASWVDPNGKCWLVKFPATDDWTFAIIIGKARMEFRHLWGFHLDQHAPIGIEVKPEVKHG